MRHRISAFVVFVVLALAAIVVPVACSSDDNGGTDSGTDAMTRG